MNVKELIAKLDQFPEDMEVIIPMHSDYSPIIELFIVAAVDKTGYVMRYHKTMSKDNLEASKSYLLLTHQ